tara:strand:- start:192 stop:347 length:156 start_codon:yes stop_codon:yes gene_type:complete
VKEEYSNPKECGKFISHKGLIFLPFPTHTEVVANSPTPSRHKIAAFLKLLG